MLLLHEFWMTIVLNSIIHIFVIWIRSEKIIIIAFTPKYTNGKGLKREFTLFKYFGHALGLGE